MYWQKLQKNLGPFQFGAGEYLNNKFAVSIVSFQISSGF